VSCAACPCCTRAERATDRRSNGGAPAVRAAFEDRYHGGIFIVSAPSSSSAYLRCLPAPAHARPSRHPRRAARHERRRRQAVVQAVPSHQLIGSRLYTFLVPLASRVDHPVRPPRRNPAPPRTSPPVVAVRRRGIPPCPDRDYLSVLGEPTLDLELSPGRESRRSRRNPGEPAASHGQGPDCRARNLSRVFCVN
jgi:hypothetical protein